MHFKWQCHPSSGVPMTDWPGNPNLQPPRGQIIELLRRDEPAISECYICGMPCSRRLLPKTLLVHSRYQNRTFIMWRAYMVTLLNSPATSTGNTQSSYWPCAIAGLPSLLNVTKSWNPIDSSDINGWYDETPWYQASHPLGNRVPITYLSCRQTDERNGQLLLSGISILRGGNHLFVDFDYK